MAAEQDSFITSPSWPVTVNLPFAGTTETSMTSKIAADFGPRHPVGEADFVRAFDFAVFMAVGDRAVRSPFWA